MTNISFITLCPLVLAAMFSFSFQHQIKPGSEELALASRIDTFTFMSNGIPFRGKIFLPPSYEKNRHLPTIYLIDYTEQHFKLATDEFERVIDGVAQLDGVEALVVSLESIQDINAEPAEFRQHFEVFRDMSLYVEHVYSDHTSKTLIGKGSESGIVLMALFLEGSDGDRFHNFIATDPSPAYANALMNLIASTKMSDDRSIKKLHFSFSTSNDRARCTKLIEMIRSAEYPWLNFESREYTESNYENTYPVSFADGLRFVFSR